MIQITGKFPCLAVVYHTGTRTDFYKYSCDAPAVKSAVDSHGNTDTVLAIFTHLPFGTNVHQGFVIGNNI